jgi:prepilin-type N-terminal cleavage/methylation domain-containing protein
MSSSVRLDGFTLLELLAVIAVIAILALLFTPNMSGYLRRAGEVRCVANMRSITVALRGYLADNANVWPQGPSQADEEPWEQFWVGALKAQGITASTWQCPTIRASSRGSEKLIHYAPTSFPPVPGFANRWSTHPWLIERGNAHGKGALICFPDGSTKPFDKVLAELGVR